MIRNSRTQPGKSADVREKSPSTRVSLPNEPETADVANALGAEVALLRKGAGLTAASLAQRAGISPAMLSRIEAGRAAPSLQTIADLAKALQIPVARLFARHDGQLDCSYVPAGQGVSVARSGARKGYRYELLGHSLSGPLFVEPYLVTLSEAAEPHPTFHHEGIEFMHVVSGRMTYRYQDAFYELGPGDTLLFDANALHGPERLTEGPISYLSIVITMRR